jgi:hypothetical protein
MPENEPKTFKQAREQNAEYLGFMASEFIKTERGEVFEIPSLNCLDDDQQTRLDKLALDVESWDRHPDVLNEDGSVRTRGDLLEPNRKGGKLVEHFSIQRAKAIFGDKYEAFKAAGGKASDLANFWWKQNRMMLERAKTDPKSVGSAEGLDTVPDSD